MMTTRSNDELIDEFRSSLKTSGKSKFTLIQYPQYVKNLADFVGGDLLSVDKKVLDRYLAHLRERELGNSAIARYFSGISTFFKFLVWNEYVDQNPVPALKEHYPQVFGKKSCNNHWRKLISIDQAKALVASIFDPRELAVVVLLLKSGIRRNELSTLDLDDVDLPNHTLHLKPTAKRTNLEVYFDDEAILVLKRWLLQREKDNKKHLSAFFLDRFGNRLSPVAVARIVLKHGIANGLHDTSSDDIEDHFTTHCCRHWFVTHLRRAGMPREFIQFLRGDAITEAIDTYDHVGEGVDEVKASYLGKIPKLGL
jgi:integrase/recombinase XerD